MPYDDARNLLDSLEPTLEEGLQLAEERLLRELDFLQRIHKQLSTDGATITARVEELSEHQTVGFLSEYLPSLEIELEGE